MPTKAAALAATVLCLACGRSTRSSATRPSDPAAYFGIVTYTGLSFSSDKSKVLVTSDRSGHFTAYAVPTDGGNPAPLTADSTGRIVARSFFPEDDRVLYERSTGGERHLFVREADGKTVDLTPGDGLEGSFMSWAHDLKTFFVAISERDQRYPDLYEYGVYQYKRRLVYKNTEGYTLGPVSRDKRYLALVKERSASDGDVYVYEIPTHAMKLLTRHEGGVSYSAQDFTPDSRSLLVTSDEASELRALRAIDIETTHASVLLAPKGDVWRAQYSFKGKYLTATIDEDTRLVTRVYDPATMDQDSLAGMPDGVVHDFMFSREEGMYMLYAGRDGAPDDLYAGVVGFKARRLTNALGSSLDPEQMRTPSVVRITPPDSLALPGLLYKPAPDGSTSSPAIVLVGSGAVSLGYDPVAQLLANRGYVVLAVSPFAGSGDGKTISRLRAQRRAEADVGDLMAARRTLIGTAGVDSSRIGILGSEDGASFALAALSARQGAFKTAVAVLGASRLDATSGPAPDDERPRRALALFDAERVDAPVLLMRVSDDTRVPRAETDAIATALRKKSTAAEYIVPPDAQPYATRENVIKAYTHVLEFLEKQLKGTNPRVPIATSQSQHPHNDRSVSTAGWHHHGQQDRLRAHATRECDARRAGRAVRGARLVRAPHSG